MKQLLSIFSIFLLVFLSHSVNAQLSLKTEYLGSSKYHPKDGEPSTSKEGSAWVYQGNLKLPLRVSTDSIAKIWGVDVAGAMVHLNNVYLTEKEVLSHITNLQVSLFHLRPLKNNWSLLAFAGAGAYTAEHSLKKIKGNQILGNVGVIFIKKRNKNLELGGGAVLNNAFGYPMLFPAFYLNYNYEGRYEIKASVINGLELLAGYTFNGNFALYFTITMNAQLALLKLNDKEAIFTHQYIIVGLQPELKINKHISLPITLGMNTTRFAYFTDRNLKSIFQDTENDAHFGISPYAGIELKVKF